MDGPVLERVYELPEWAERIDAAERASRVVVAGEGCEVDDERFFLRGTLELPILEAVAIEDVTVFRIALWVAPNVADYIRVLHDDPESEPAHRPFFGWIANDLSPMYPPTLNLRARVHPTFPGERPLVVLEPSSHPLAIEQREGISIERVRELAGWGAHRH